MFRNNVLVVIALLCGTFYMVQSDLFKVQSRYFLFSEGVLTRQNTSEAAKICQTIGGMKLGTMKDHYRRDLLKTWVLEINENVYYDSWVWLDGYRAANSQDWIWRTSGEPITFFDWNPDYPEISLDQEACIQYKASIGWKQMPCSETWYFMCEEIDD